MIGKYITLLKFRAKIMNNKKSADHVYYEVAVLASKKMSSCHKISNDSCKKLDALLSNLPPLPPRDKKREVWNWLYTDFIPFDQPGDDASITTKSEVKLDDHHSHEYNDISEYSVNQESNLFPIENMEVDERSPSPVFQSQVPLKANKSHDNQKYEEDLEETMQELAASFSEFFHFTVPDEEKMDAQILQLVKLNPQRINSACEEANLCSLNEDQFSLFCTSFVKLHLQVNFQSACIIINNVFFKKIEKLEKNASRRFTTTMIEVCTTYPLQVIESLFIPCIHSDNLSLPIVELLLTVIKESLNEDSHLQVLLKNLTDASIEWKEPFIHFLHNCLDLEVSIDQDSTRKLCQIMNTVSTPLSGNLMFAKLIHLFILKYSSKLSDESLATIEQIVSTNKTFLKKSLQATLKKTVR